MAADARDSGHGVLFGARLVDRAVVSEVTLKIVAPFGRPEAGRHFPLFSAGARYTNTGARCLKLTSGKVIAVDQDDRPALVANTLGSGKTLLSAYPLEAYLAATPAVFEKPENTHRIYEAFREWTGVKPVFRSDQPSVEVSALNGDHRGYVVVVNHSAQAYNVTVLSTLPLRAVSRIAPEGPQSLKLDGAGWKMDIGPYEGAIVEWK